MATATSNTIYSTPDSWGNETEYAEYSAMLNTIEELKTLGGEWSNIDISDCTEWTLGVKDGTACHTDGRQYVELSHAPRKGFYAVQNWL